MANCQLIDSTSNMIEQCNQLAPKYEKMKEHINQLYKDGKMPKKIYFQNLKFIAKLVRENNNVLTKLPQKYQYMLKCKNISDSGRDIYIPDLISCLETKKHEDKVLTPQAHCETLAK